MTKCNQGILLKSVFGFSHVHENHHGGVNLRKCNKLFIVAQNCFRMAVSLELIKINSYFVVVDFLVSIWPV